MRWLKRHRIVFGLMGLAFVTLIGFQTFRYVHAYQELRSGKNLLVAAADLLQQQGLDVSEEELKEADEDFKRAGDKLDGASGVLQSDPVFFLTRRLPWLGTQVNAARDLARIGAQSSDIGVEAVAALRTFQRIRDSEGGQLSEKVVPVLSALDPHVDNIEQRLVSVRQTRSNLSRGSLLGPLRSAIDQLDDRIEELEARLADERRASRLAAQVLGYEGPQTYLVLAHDNTEILATGGLVLVYGFLTFDHGRLERVFFDNVASIVDEWPPTAGRDSIEPPEPLKKHLLVRGWPMGLTEASWWPDFPTTAEKAIEIYRVNSGSNEPIDGVIGINFLTLETLLKVLGPITVDRYGETVTSDNLIEKTLIITHPESLRPWETYWYDFTGYLARDVIQRTLDAPPTQWAKLLSALNDLGLEKNLLLYHSDPNAEEAIAELGWDGGIVEGEGDYLMVIDSNLRRNKVNQVVESGVDLRVTLDERGNATNAVTVSYRYDHSSWAQGKDDRLVYLTTLGGRLDLYGDYLRVVVPQDSDLQAVAVGGLPVEVEDIGVDWSRMVYGHYFSMPPDATQELTFEYEVPAAVNMSGNPYEYRLYVQKQPGTRAIPLTITVEPAIGLEIVSTELDGVELEDGSARVTTVLGRDRQVVVTYEPLE
jgi:hypothetical protein